MGSESALATIKNPSAAVNDPMHIMRRPLLTSIALPATGDIKPLTNNENETTVNVTVRDKPRSCAIAGHSTAIE
jgi:hypothetical protein